MKQIRVRFAPSPTGYLHIGGLRTALYDFLFARSVGGKFILRIEDTDRNRLVEDAAEKLISALERMGIELDEGPGIGGDFGPYVQSERLELYHREAQRLLDSGNAYRCFCSAERLSQMREQQQQKGEFVKYDRHCLSLSEDEVQERLGRGEQHVVRLKMPDERVFAFTDLIRGSVEMDAAQSDDQVIIKSDGFPTYHLAAVIDDHYMEISHVIRGEEWLSSTPKHIWLNECLGWEAPLWVHLPLILNQDRSKLSKRMNDVSVDSYLERGYFKEAIINFIALLGWHSADDQEIYSLEELCKVFSLERVNKAGAVFDLTKLDWMNGIYMRSLDPQEVFNRALPYFTAAGYSLESGATSLKMIEIARERCTLLPELVDYCKIFLSRPELSPEKQELLGNEDSRKVLQYFLALFDNPDEGFGSLELADLPKAAMQELGIKGKQFFTPLRLALIRQEHGPDLPSIWEILGKAETVSRLREALNPKSL